MPCFRPLTNYLIKLTEELITLKGIEGDFLEIGSGNGAFTEIFARLKIPGTAIDLSQQAVTATKKRVTNYETEIQVYKQNFMDLPTCRKYGVILMYDVLEHIEEDELVAERVHALLKTKGYFLISFPVKMNLWSWDDEYYGHVRRYDDSDIDRLFNNDRFSIVKKWDITFPFIYVLRKLYLILLKDKNDGMKKEDRTENSAFSSAAGNGVVMNLVEKFPIWPLLFAIQNLFREKNYGCNILLLVQRRD